MARERRDRPRLLVLTSTLPRWARDSEPRFVLDLAAALSDRFEPVILAPSAPGAAAAERINGVSIRRYRYAPLHSWERLASPGAIMPNLRRWPWLYALVPGFFLAQLAATVSLLRRERFDLVHCHWLIPQGLVLALASFFVAVPPALVTCHGADAFTLDSPAARRLKRWILSRFAAVTVVSREIGDKLNMLTGAPHSIAVSHIAMGVDAARFSAPGPSAEGTPIILYAGRIAAKKGVLHLVEAMADPRLRTRAVRLRIVGGGPLLEKIKATAAELGIAERVDFTGPVPQEQLVDEMRSATLFCAPFVVADDGDREGTPTVLLEAAACALPIITSDVGGCGDIVANRRSGWLLPPGDKAALVAAIEEALERPEQARRFGGTARERAKLYSWPAIADRYAAVLSQLMPVPICEQKHAA